MKRIATMLAGGMLLIIATAAFVWKSDEPEGLDGRTFKVTITETKKGKAGKPEEGEISFKSGKMRSKWFGTEMGAEVVKYELVVDSMYTEDGEDIPYIEFQAEITNKLEEVVKFSGTLDGYSLQGTAELFKKDKLKRHVDFIGGQKEKKGKK